MASDKTFFSLVSPTPALEEKHPYTSTTQPNLRKVRYFIALLADMEYSWGFKIVV